MPRVLIVEDEVIVAMELQSHLEALDYTVVDAVTTGADAIDRALPDGPPSSGAPPLPDLILMDIHLDGPMDGIEAARRIRDARDVPVVFLTAYSDEATLQRAKDVAPYGYIVKPFEERDLYVTLEVALHKHALNRKLQKSHDDLRQILDGLRLGTAMTDPQGRLTFLNRAAERLLATARADAEGQRWDAAFPLPDAAMDELRTIAGRPPDVRRKVRARLEHDGGRYWTEIEVQNDPRAPGRRLFLFYDVTETVDLRQMLDERASHHEIVGKSDAMQDVFRMIDQVAAVSSTALIHGETGTGKELVARAIHEASPRAGGPFIPVNCAALTDELAASHLFGHTKGAFTGATADREGFFEAADGGTLFLDEIGDVPLDVQVNLLRVLEERTITRVGETTSRSVDVRIVAATHRDLPAEVDAGRFRQDLLYRIRIARIDLPPLRARRDDIPLLTRTFLEQVRASTGKTVTEVSTAAMRCLLDYDWPGNVRELRNAIEYGVIRCQGTVLEADDLPPELRDEPARRTAASAPPEDERSRILAALDETNDNRTEAAELLGISRATLYRRLDEYGIE